MSAGFTVINDVTPASAEWWHEEVRPNLVFVVATTAALEVPPAHRFVHMRVKELQTGNTVRWNGSAWVIDDGGVLTHAILSADIALKQGASISVDDQSSIQWWTIGRHWHAQIHVLCTSAGTATQPIELTVPVELNLLLRFLGVVMAGPTATVPVSAQVVSSGSGSTTIRFNKTLATWFGDADTVASGWALVGTLSGWLAG